MWILRPSPLRSAAALGLAVTVLGLTATSCENVSYYSFTGAGNEGEGAGSPTTSTATEPPSITRAAVLEATGTCAAALYGQASSATKQLASATSALAASPDAEKVKAARDAWALAIDVWQQAELVHVGPTGPTGSPGGEAKRDLVYSWPLVSRCLVEQKLVAKAYESATFFDSALVNMRGLAAVEYLLFYEGTDNECSASSTINSTGAWQAMSPDELASRKRAYAAAASADVAAQVEAISATWSSGSPSFAAALATAGQEGSIFSTDRLAMNLVSDGLFYLDTETKDRKLGAPLGLLDCATATCPEAVESRYGRRSRTHVKNNLAGLRRVLFGCDESNGVGFDDLLTALGKGDLADRISADIDSALAAADALASDDIALGLSNEPAKVTALHAAVKKITDALKTEFVTVLDLELPQNVEGDND